MSSNIEYRWLVYCIEEAIDVGVWSATGPTQCPNIHGDRSIETSRTRVVDSRNMKKNFFKIYPQVKTIVSKDYYLTASFDFLGSDNIGTIYSIYVLALSEGVGSNFDIRIYNPSSAPSTSVIAEKTGLNNSTIALINMGTIANVPTDRTTLEVQVKRTTGSKKIGIREITVYYGPELS